MRSVDVILHLHQSSGHIDTLEEGYVTHLPRLGDVMRLILPGDSRTSDYVVYEIRHEFVIGVATTYRQAQVEIIANRKVV